MTFLSSAGRALAVVFALALTATDAAAQLRLPSLPSVQLPLPGQIGPLDTRALQDPLRPLQDVAGLRLDLARDLLRRHPGVLQADPHGFPMVARQLLAVTPSAGGLAAAARLGLDIMRGAGGDGDDGSVVLLRVPAGADTARVLDQLRAADPDGIYDFNHIYLGARGAMGVDGGATPDVGDRVVQPGRDRGVSAGGSAAHADEGAAAAHRIGLVDSGVDARHIVFARARVEQWGCGGKAHPAEHGTAVASLMVGRARRFRGALPGAQLYAADIYCDEPTGGSVDRIAAALAWLARERVPVINLSIVGPANVVLERVVANMVKRGHVLVAAVGNDGPAAPPLYPASYPRVVGVTAVDRNGKVLPEAARGPQVMFAAPGNQMVGADWNSGEFRQLRGTSFASPIVAALLAPMVARPDASVAREAVNVLAQRAGGARSPEVGFGVVGADLRVDPAAVSR